MNEQTSMEGFAETGTFVTDPVAESSHLGKWKIRLIAGLLATLTMLVVWKIAVAYPYIDPDSSNYQAMADGKIAMKPFAFRVLGPAAAQSVATLLGKSTTDGFVIVAFLSGWFLLYCVLLPALGRDRYRWLIPTFLLLPFWLRNFENYFLPDLFHAALCMVYLVLLRWRRWGWAAATLVLMFLARESTLLVAAVAVSVLWWVAEKSAAMMQLAGAFAGLATSKFAARNAAANLHHMNDTLYLIGKIPWNLSRNLLGVTLWTNTLHPEPPLHVWNLPRWTPTGNIHQIGYAAYHSIYQISTAVQLLTAFGLGSCLLFILVWRNPLRNLLPKNEPYLCIAAIYGAITFLLAPALGAAMTRLFDYGWPLFLLYLPAVIPRVWRHWPTWIVVLLLPLHLITAWTEPARLIFFHFNIIGTFVILIVCNLAAATIWFGMTSPYNKRKSPADTCQPRSPGFIP